MDVGFWLLGRWSLVEWTLNFGCTDSEFWLYGRWILSSETSVQRQIWTLLQLKMLMSKQFANTTKLQSRYNVRF